MIDGNRSLEVADALAAARGARVGIALPAIFCLFTLLWPSFSEVTLAQRRTQRRQTRSTPPRKPTIDYSKFSHATKKHQEECSTCHKNPTDNWQKVRGLPDVADYPDHETCVSCHRQQFFKGARPAICTICHSKVSPRDDVRFAFRNPIGLRQFTIEFPHDTHQDVIASLRQPARDEEKTVMFLKASLPAAGHFIDEKTKKYSNCEICHGSRTKSVVAPPGGWVDGSAPAADTFKSSPESHAACFSCHWKGEAPIADKCDGCHKLTPPYTAADWPKRISMKFRHEGGGERKNHVAECTTCHINITKAATLRGLSPDVPITACTECHNKSGQRQDLDKELVQLEKNKDFLCVYCHTSDVGSRDGPFSHFGVAERPPIKRKDMK